MLQLIVKDINAARNQIESMGDLLGKYEPIKQEPWGKVIYLWGPAGELWHITELTVWRLFSCRAQTAQLESLLDYIFELTDAILIPANSKKPPADLLIIFTTDAFTEPLDSFWPI